MSSKHRWIAFTGQSAGTLVIDEGACKAIAEKGKSLLPAGIKKISGEFKQGDTVDLQTEEKLLIARGLTNYSSKEIEKIMGCNSADITQRIGQKPLTK